MTRFKHVSIMMLMALYAGSMVWGQSRGSEMSIEESYLQEAVEMMIIRETSRSDSHDQKMIALDYIGSALERGSTNDELRTSLEYLSLEGTLNRARMGSRPIYSYPDVRRQAAKYLGEMGTKEAKNVLLKICTNDNEPMVLQEAIKSLGTIGINENADSISTVVWVATRNLNSTNPDDILAIAAIDAIEKFAEKDGTIDRSAVELIAKMMEGPYALPVKERARQSIVNLRKYSIGQ